MDRSWILLLYTSFAAICLASSHAAKTDYRMRSWKNARDSITKSSRRSHNYAYLRRLGFTKMVLDSSNSDPYVSSPFSLPPYESLPPLPYPENTPPFCVYPLPPSTIPSPIGEGSAPPPPTFSVPTLPISPTPEIPSPQITPIPIPPPTVPAPTLPDLSPPFPSYVPTPYGGFVPSPITFLPPIVFPPPTVPPPPHMASTLAQWCVAKASVPDPIIEEAMNYACGSGADCEQIQPSGSCFQPNTLFAHASYAFNSYWQRTKVGGGTCDFGGTAILVTVDPSFDGCHFLYF